MLGQDAYRNRKGLIMFPYERYWSGRESTCGDRRGPGNCGPCEQALLVWQGPLFERRELTAAFVHEFREALRQLPDPARLLQPKSVLRN